MNKTCLRYFEDENVLHLVVSDELAQNHRLSPNISIELIDNNKMVGVEILKASGFQVNKLQESLQAALATHRSLKLSNTERRE